MKGSFVIVDGIDGSGKGTVVEGLKDLERSKGSKILDLRDYCRENNRFPSKEEIQKWDVVVSSEPTYCYVGRALREEFLFASDIRYPPRSLVQAFSLDREILYNRVIIPALKLGKKVFQERCLASSLVYQPVQEKIPLTEILRLTGNMLALRNAPDILIITSLSPEAAAGRLRSREKKDNSIFDELEFQAKIAERYSSEWLRKIFENNGSKVVRLNTDPPKTEEDTKEEAFRIIEDNLK